MESPTFVLNAADWLASPEARTGAAGHPAYLGPIALAAAHLEHLSVFEAPADALRAPLDEATSEIPPQFAMLDREEPFAFWLQAAAIAEHCGAFRLSARMLIEMVRLVREDRRAGQHSEASTAERLALCWTRRGRIARTLGDIEQAVQWYEQARRAVQRTPIQDAYPQAVLGLSAAALNRGNIPRAARLLVPLLRLSAKLPALYRMPAHQLMAVVRRKQGQFTDALLHVWAAFDLLTASDFRREQLVGTMAEIALEAGDIDAASLGFEAVLQTNVVPMVRVPALWGAIKARLAKIKAREQEQGLRDARLHDYSEEVQSLKSQRLAPATEVMVHLCDAELAVMRADVQGARTALARADRLAQEAGFFERQFLIDELRARLDSRADASAAPSSPVERPRKARGAAARHPALQRLLQLRLTLASTAPE